MRARPVTTRTRAAQFRMVQKMGDWPRLRCTYCGAEVEIAPNLVHTHRITRMEEQFKEDHAECKPPDEEFRDE